MSQAQPFFPIPGVSKRPPSEHTTTNQNKAMLRAQAATYKAVYPAPFDLSITQIMLSFGLDVNDTSTAPTTPEGIGNLAVAEPIRQHYKSNWNADVSGVPACQEPCLCCLACIPAFRHVPPPRTSCLGVCRQYFWLRNRGKCTGQALFVIALDGGLMALLLLHTK